MTNDSSADRNDWVRWATRAGHVAKGVVYALIGTLAIQAAFGSRGRAAGGEEALEYVGSQPFGQVLLTLIGVGLAGYALWRCLMAAQDPEGEGSDAKGLIKRAGFLVSGLTNAFLAITAFQMAFGSAGGDGDGAKTWAAMLMSEPFGQIGVGVAGISIVLVGLYQLRRAHTKDFLQRLDLRRASSELRHFVTRLGQVGYAARGVVFPIIGGGLLVAAIEHDPNEAMGLGDALHALGSSTFGQVTLVVVAAGLLAFAAFTLVAAKYTVVRVRAPV